MSNPKNKITKEDVDNMKKEMIRIIHSLPDEFRNSIPEAFKTKNTY
jgi:hypothetical protein